MHPAESVFFMILFIFYRFYWLLSYVDHLVGLEEKDREVRIQL